MTMLSTPTPSLQPLVDLTERIAELEAQRTEMLDHLISDCEFMDVPVVEVYYFDVDDRDRRPGTAYHYVEIQNEYGSDRVTLHPAAGCTRPWCRAGETVKFPKYMHVGKRSFYTRRVDHVLAGTVGKVESSLFGPSEIEVFTFVPVSQSRAAAS